MTEKILCVDDDPEVLAAFQRAFRKRFHIDTEGAADRALLALEQQGPYAVVVADLGMPGMNGLQFLAEVKKTAPQSIRIMLTGAGDQANAVEAINQGQVFRFLTKPCPPELLAEVLALALAEYRSAIAERDLLQKTLSSSVKLLTDLLALTKPQAFARSQRALGLVKRIFAALKPEGESQIELAAMLSHLGCVTLSDEILIKVATGLALSAKEAAIFERHPQIGHDLLARIPRLEAIASIVAYQEKRYDGSGPPDDTIRGEEIPLEARVLKVVLDFDSLVAGGRSYVPTFQELRRREGWYDPAVLWVLLDVLREDGFYVVHRVKLRELTSEMLLGDDIRSESGEVVLTRGQELAPAVRIRLKSLAERLRLADEFPVLLPAA